MTMSNPEFGEEDEGRQHPPEYREDLNPAALELETIRGTAADLKPVNEQLSAVPDGVLERLPVVAEGSRLKQGSTYIDLRAPQLGEFVATGDMVAGEGSQIVPKARADYEAWSELLDRLGVKARA